MKYIEVNSDYSMIYTINETLAPLENLISSKLSIKSITEECNFLNKVESMIPEDLQLQLHLNMILDESKKKLSEYNRNLAKGKNLVIERALKCMSVSESNKIKESFDSLFETFKNSIKYNSILEQIESIPIDQDAISAEYEKDFTDVTKNIENLNNTPTNTSNKTSITDLLKGLLMSLTEEGSEIGVFQFILDIVGIFGDFFGPVGLIADVLNGIIYLFRKKYMLALISFIAAMIPFGGNVLKGWLQTSKIGKSVIDVGEIYLKEGSKAGAKVTDDAAKIIAKSAPESIKSLEYISKKGKEAMGGLAGFLSDFFDKFLGKIVGWIPLIGKPLKAFFSGVSGVISSFASRVTKFADDVPKAITKAEVDTMEEFFKYAGKEGSEITLKGSDLIVTTSKGKSAIIPSNLLKGTDFMVQRYGTGAGKKMQKALDRLQISSADFYKSLDNGLRSVNKAYGKTANIGKSTFSFTKNVPLFIGKQLWKLLRPPGSDDQKLSDSEYEAWGMARIYDLIQNRIKQTLKENPKASYHVPYIDNLSDNEAVETMRQTQNDYAEMLNLPNINAIGWYTRGEKDKRPEEVTKFYEDLYDGDTRALDQMIEDFPAFESSGINLKYIKPYSQFI